MEAFIQVFSQLQETYCDVYVGIVRYAAPVLIGLLLMRCFLPLLTFKREPEIWAWLTMPEGDKVPVTHWENVIGRSKSSDIQIDYPTVSRNHAVLTRYDDGSWTITDAGSKAGTLVNGKDITIRALRGGETITIGGVDLKLSPITQRQEIKQAQLRTKAANAWDSVLNLLLLTIFQCMACLGFLLNGEGTHMMATLQGFGGILICQWLLFVFYVCIHRASFEVETIAFFLCTMGMCAICAVKPGETMKQLIAMVLGIAVFLGLGWSLRDLERAKKVRYLAVVMGVVFLVITLLFGKEYYGAKNWLVIGSYTIQPSELSKVCFVYAGASAMDRLMNRRNLILFIAYSVLICGCLALMNDFGTALIFFCAFLVIAYLRSGSVGTIALACTSLGFAGVIALKIAPHALRRFSVWRHIWDDPYNAGYQQTRALMCIASGGLFGLGAGQGKMKNIFAADSDVVFATIAEEWGLLICVMTVVCIIVLALFALRSASVERSSFYIIGACTAAGILLVQAPMI